MPQAKNPQIRLLEVDSRADEVLPLYNTIWDWRVFSIEVLFVVKRDTEAQRRSITQILCWCKLEITSPGVILGKTATFL